MATRTFIQIAEAVADDLELRRSGTLTASSATALTAGNYPYKTNRTGASTKTYEGAEIYTTSGTAPAPNPNGISAYAPSTGIFTPSVDYTTTPGSTSTFDIYLRGVSITDIKNAVNEALRLIHFETIVPLTLVTDGDMENSGVGDWTATNATHTKVASAGNLQKGAQASRVLATAALGQIRSGLIAVDPGFQHTFYLQADVRAAVGTGRLIAYDNTNSTVIDSKDWTSAGWGRLYFNFTLPSTCESLAIILRSVANADDAYWDNVMLLRTGAREVALPSWVIRRDQVRAILRDVGSRDEVDRDYLVKYPSSEIIADLSNPLNQWRAGLRPSVSGPVWLHGFRPHTALSADTDTTFCDRTLLEKYAAVMLLQRLQNRPPSQEVDSWRAEYRKRLSELKRILHRLRESNLRIVV